MSVLVIAEHHQGKLADNVSKHNALLNRLKKKGGRKGGREGGETMKMRG